MRKAAVLLVILLAVAGLAGPVSAAEYDRYERGYTEPPPPPPPPPRAAPVPRQRHAQSGEPYVIGHLGIYDPNSESDGLAGYDTGFSFDLGLGSRISPVFAVEGMIGGFGAENGGNDVSVVPLTIGVRLIVPNPVVEPYMGAGFGLYFASLDEGPEVNFSGIDDDTTEFGGYLALGVDFWLNPRMALNFEGKYHWVDASFESNAGTDFNVDLSGWVVNFGLRLSF